MHLLSFFEPVHPFCIKSWENHEKGICHADLDGIIVMNPFVVLVTKSIEIKIYQNVLSMSTLSFSKYAHHTKTSKSNGIQS